jgi:hypothetical protein
MSKTVFVLGAGFSAPARMPVKTDVMRGVIRGSAQSEVRRTYQTLFQMLDAQDFMTDPALIWDW